MCIGTPLRVTQTGDGYAWCEGRGGRQRLDTLLVGPQPPGSWLLAFHGSALRTMSPEDAARTNAALDALEAALAGEDDFGAFFSDLVGREPRLPEHLSKANSK